MSMNQSCGAKALARQDLSEIQGRIEQVKELVNNKLETFATDFCGHLPLQKYLKTANSILLSKDAKRIRSILPVLIADAGDFERETCFKYGITIELLHYSSLIHDDVIDNDIERRGVATLNHTFTNSHAVLIGDFMMCSVIEFALNFNHSREVINLMVNAIKKLVAGLVIEQTILPEDPTESNYLEMADLKTGALFELSFGLPFIDHEYLPDAMMCGRIFGLLFQIYDDYSDRHKDKNNQNIFHIMSTEKIIRIWNEQGETFMKHVEKLQIADVAKEMLAYLRTKGYFEEVATPQGTLFTL